MKLQEMMNLIEAQRDESRRDGDNEDEDDEDEEEEESTVCVNIVMTVKPEWIDEVKFRESFSRFGSLARSTIYRGGKIDD